MEIRLHLEEKSGRCLLMFLFIYLFNLPTNMCQCCSRVLPVRVQVRVLTVRVRVRVLTIQVQVQVLTVRVLESYGNYTFVLRSM